LGHQQWRQHARRGNQRDAHLPSPEHASMLRPPPETRQE
jgi:hypothetical protein